jgi:hypothetical protein
MFIGHYAASLAAKSAEPSLPLWTCVAGAQLIDIGWGSLILAGVEHGRIDPSLPGSQLDLYFMPYTHSLPAALLWAAAAALLLLRPLRLSGRAALILAAVVFSHGLLDLLVHWPDLALWFGGPKAGFAFWNAPVAEMAVEMGLLVLAGAVWTAARRARALAIWPAVAFLALLVAIQTGFLLGPILPSIQAVAMFALAIYALSALAAWRIDRRDAGELAPSGS